MWTFHNTVPQARREELLKWPSFTNIVGRLMFEAQVQGFRWEHGDSSHLRNCRRSDFLLRVPQNLYDAFFNSPVGYRGQYAISPDIGILKNRELIDALSTKLIAFIDGTDDVGAVRASLGGSEAKVWIDEDEREVQEHGYDDTPEIDFAVWAANSDTGIGLRAPLGERLVVLGGWLDRYGNERLNPAKSRRSEDIHETGFS